MARPYYQLEHFEPTEAIGFLVKRCATLLTANGERTLARMQPGLSLTQWIVLVRLSRAPHLSASTLAADIGHDLGSLTRVVDTLVDDGYVRRARSLVDRRGVELRVTAAGRRLVDQRMPHIVALLNELLDDFTIVETRQLHVLLKRLMQTLQRHLDEPLAPLSETPPIAAARPRRPRSTLRKPA